jgi:hypothetical protein
VEIPGKYKIFLELYFIQSTLVWIVFNYTAGTFYQC